MTDSESKARKKLEEAEKKSKGSTGFFAGLFGSNKADEAVDLFVQETSKSVPLVCTEFDCRQQFDDVVAYEDHVLTYHAFQCSICGRRYLNEHCLNIHFDEYHCSIFKVRHEQDPTSLLYRCYDQHCLSIFSNPVERDDHCFSCHNIMNGNQVTELRRKIPKPHPSLVVENSQAIKKVPRLNRVPRNAGNLFKVAKLWKDAGEAFVKAAELNAAKGDAKHDTASNYAEAANCFRKVNPQVAVDCLMKTAEIYTDMGRFNMAAKNHCTIAELYENECPDKAADYYKGEESKSSATKCLLKVAQYAAQLEQYKKAIQIFEEVALWEADHQTLKYAAKNHFFQALLCHLCIDLLDTQHALKRYEEISPSFADTREAKLIKELITCVEEQDVDTFTDAVKNYDKISRLDQWHTALLVKIKKSCSDEDDLK
uniref:C2H2-type domain-containing protein n=1 Tax=Syphacia muris TaxID=451379 RepID=A0A158R5L3_9BILA